MRRLVAIVAMFLAAPAGGQDEGGADAVTGSEWRPTVDTYVVERGDTLWDISARVVASPWLWPRVWSYNPEITNPNWIYPGDIIRFFPSDQEMPRQTQLVSDVRELPAADEPAAIEEVTPPAVEAVETTALPPQGPAGLSHFVGLLVTPRELAEAGTLTNSAEDKMLLATKDSVFLSFPEGGRRAAAGEKYMVYRTLGKVIHPRTHEAFGYMTQVTAVTSVEDVDKRIARARIDQAVVEVERGQYVTPWSEDLFTPVQPAPAAKAIEGVVLAVQFEAGVMAGEHQIVFVDKGTKDGLVRGNQLHVLVRGDPLTDAREGLPFDRSGTLLVMHANETAATCLVVDSRLEIEPGARVVAVTQ